MSRAPLRERLVALDRRRVAGLVLVVGWVVWLAVAWVAEVRLVSVATLEDDLEAGRVVAFREVLLEPPGSDAGWVESPGIGYWTVDSLGRLDDDSAVDGTGASVTVTYWVDGPVATQRVLDLGGDRAAAAAVGDRLRAAGVPPDLSFGSDFIEPHRSRRSAGGRPRARDVRADRAGPPARPRHPVVLVLAPHGARWGSGCSRTPSSSSCGPGASTARMPVAVATRGSPACSSPCSGACSSAMLVSWLAEWAPLVLRP